ncbi:MAG TPA: SRPBCC domain-containing protein [Acidimicrobiia bacterium]
MEPIVVEFEVACSPDHTFEMWTERAAMWWPRSHSMSQDAAMEVSFEPHVGGRVFERATDGSEFEWGEVTVWEPPERIGYLWHLFFDRSQATDIQVTFSPTGTGTTVQLRQTGFERLPSDVGLTRRNRTEGAWAEVARHYREVLDATE